MRVYILVSLLLVAILTLDVIGQCEGWWGGGSSSKCSSSSGSGSSSRSSSSSRRSSSSSRRTQSSSGSSSKSSSGGWWGGSRKSSSKTSSSSKGSSSSSSSDGSKSSSTDNADRGVQTAEVRGKTIHAGKTGIRERDETGHRTGVGTLYKKMKSQPVKTMKAAWEFGKSYVKMRKANIKGGNLPAHEEANRKATEVSDKETAAAFSALREQYKRVRVKENPDGSVHVGDTRTQKEIDDTMAANKKGRESAEPNSGENP